MVLVAQDAPLPVYHNLSVMPHTGQLAYSVDLFRIKDVDFDWSIGLLPIPAMVFDRLPTQAL